MKKVVAGLMAVLSLLLVGGIVRATTEGPSQPWKAPDDARKVKNPVMLTSRGLMAASDLYEQKCVVCHGDEGAGNGPAAPLLSQKPADFTDSKRMSQVTDGELFWKMSTGRGQMPSWKAGLSETERWQMVSYLRVLTTYGLYKYLGKPIPNR